MGELEGKEEVLEASFLHFSLVLGTVPEIRCDQLKLVKVLVNHYRI